MQTNVIRRIDVRATTSGVDESRQKLVQFGAAQTDAATSAGELARAMEKTQRAMDLNNRMYQQAVEAQRAAAAANDNYAQSSNGVGAALRIATKAAIDQGSSYLIAAGKATAFAFAAAAVATILSGLYVIYKTVSTAIGLVSDAWELSGQRLAEHTKIARDAAAVDLSNDYFQRITKAATDSKLPVDALTDSIKKLNESATEKLGGSSLQKTLAAHLEAGNFQGNTGVSALLSANNGDERLKAMVSLLDQAVAKGERLAAMDVLGKTMGAGAAEAFRKNAEYFRNIEDSASKIAAKDLVPDADVARALDLERRFNAAAEILSQRWHPLQDVLAELGIKMREAWVGIVEQIAFAVDGAVKLVAKIAEIPQTFWDYIKRGANAAGAAITEATTTPESRKAAERQLGISSNPNDMADLAADQQRAAATEQLKVKLLGLDAVERARIETQTVYNAVRKDTSKTLDKEVEQTKETADAYDRAYEAVTKHTARLQADTLAVGLGAGALEEYRARSQLTVAAQVAGRQPTAALTAEIEKQARAAGEASAELAKMRVGDQIKFDRQTAFLSPEDLQIAQQLRSVYGNDVPAALASSEAAAMRFNNQLKSINDIARNAVSSFANDLVSGLRNGQSAMAALGQAANNLSQTLTSGALTSLLKGDFLSAGIQGIGAIITSIFGNASKKREKAEADAKAAAERIEGYAQRAALARIDTSTEAGALQAFDIQATKQRADEARAGGKGMADLERALAEERLAIIDKFNKDAAAAEEAARKAALQRAATYQDRLFAATNDNSTLDGALAEFNRKAMQDQASEIESGGQAINDLIAAQEAERLGIYKKFNDEAIAAAKQTADELVKYVQGVQKKITDYLQGLKTSASSTLSPQGQLAAANDNFNTVLASAQGGNRDALDSITTAAQTLLDQAKSFYASSGGYADVFARVTSSLQGVAGISASTVSDADKITAAVQAGATQTVLAVQAGANGTTQAVNITGAQADALSAAQNALAAQQVVFLQTQYALLGSINTLADRFVNAINGLGSLTAAIAGQEIGLLAQIAKGTGKTFWNWLGFEKGGVIPGYAEGGLIGNGEYGRDSVVARYAGGGPIALAGGEYVMPADQTRQFLPMLEAMRSGRFANDNGASAGIDWQPLAVALKQIMEISDERIARKIDELIEAIDETPEKNTAATRRLVAGMKQRAG